MPCCSRYKVFPSLQNGRSLLTGKIQKQHQRLLPAQPANSPANDRRVVAAYFFRHHGKMKTSYFQRRITMSLMIIWKTVVLYLVVIVSMRLMGKRQIGELQPFEFAVALMISELAAFPLSESDSNIWEGIVPIIILVATQFLVSLLSIKSVKARELICGRPRVMIMNGALQEQNLRKELYTVNDLLEQLRIAGIQNISDVEHGILETNGQLSLVLKSQKRPLVPSDLGIETKYEGISVDLIIDGKIHTENLKLVKLDMEWLQKKLREGSWSDPKDIFYASLDTQGNLFLQPKLKATKNRKLQK